MAAAGTMSKPVQRFVWIAAFAGVLLLLCSWVLPLLLARNPQKLATQTFKKIAGRAHLARKVMADGAYNDSSYYSRKLIDLYKNQKIGLYLFYGDSLVAWNNTQILPPAKPSTLHASNGSVETSQGLCYYEKKQRGNKCAVALLLLRPRYELENRYLRNRFVSWLGLPEEVDYSLQGGTPVTFEGRVLFYLKSSGAEFLPSSFANLSYAFFLLALVLLGFVALNYLYRNPTRKYLLGIVISLLLIRVLMILFRFPAAFYESTLYDVRIFGNAASLAQAYLGDIILNGLCMLLLSAALLVCALSAGKTRRTVLAFAAILLVYLPVEVNFLLRSLVTDSTLNFNFLDVINVSLPALFALAGVGCFGFSIFTLSSAVVRCLPDNRKTTFFLLAAAATAVIVMMLAGEPLPDALWPLFMAGLIIACFALRIQPVAHFATFLLLLSVVFSALLYRHIVWNESRDLEVLSAKLSERKDAVLEHEYARIPRGLVSDQRLANLVNILPNTSDAIADLLTEKYFNGYFRRYNVKFSLFDSNCIPLLDNTDPLLMNEGYFTDQVRLFADSTRVSGLYFVNNLRQNPRYIGIVSLGSNKLYVLMEARQFEELGSFPDLLLDESQQRQERLKGFSYAVYRDGQAISTFGSINYPEYYPGKERLEQAETAYRHWFFEPDPFSQIVVSRPFRSAGSFFTSNSYMLLLLSVLGFALYFAHSFFFSRRFMVSSLTRRIQFIIIFLLFVSMTAVGLISARLVRQRFAEENRQDLREKTGIIYTDLAALYKPSQIFDPVNRDAINLRLNEYARLFNTDISLFDATGRLQATSQPRLYALGLSAPLAHPEAMRVLRENVSGAVTIRERAGTLSYLSLYSAIFANGSSAPVGFINLPYFARQTELVSELSAIINGLVNVYVILFIVSIMAGLTLAGYITRPLRLVQQQIAEVSLGKKNEAIRWKGRDELGQLVAGYNEMLLKLEKSAEKLARSERESAWREMARQVAHEIKNPLTPMKLNLQYLQHLQQADPEEFSRRFAKASAGIIEQIDTLASIATEFSNFAQLPQGQVQEINVAEVLESALQLYEKAGKVTLRNRIPEKIIMVKGDKEQCLRVFNNLLANSVQALEEVADGWVEIGRQMKNDSVVIQVRDNGPGIADEMKPRIFTPNFTTKSTGSGLGLAMVKSIIEGFGGKVWFESEQGLGTIFYLEFRLAEREKE